VTYWIYGNRVYQEKERMMMKCYDELVARGLIAQVTDEDEIRNMVNEGKAVFYIGFDPTWDILWRCA
jgi:tyrosyl-tRNA synthetase